MARRGTPGAHGARVRGGVYAQRARRCGRRPAGRDDDDAAPARRSSRQRLLCSRRSAEDPLRIAASRWRPSLCQRPRRPAAARGPDLRRHVRGRRWLPPAVALARGGASLRPRGHRAAGLARRVQATPARRQRAAAHHHGGRRGPGRLLAHRRRPLHAAPGRAPARPQGRLGQVPRGAGHPAVPGCRAQARRGRHRRHVRARAVQARSRGPGRGPAEHRASRPRDARCPDPRRRLPCGRRGRPSCAVPRPPRPPAPRARVPRRLTAGGRDRAAPGGHPHGAARPRRVRAPRRPRSGRAAPPPGGAPERAPRASPHGACPRRRGARPCHGLSQGG